MKVYSVFDKEFAEFGQVLEGFDFSALLEKMKDLPNPKDSTVYKMGEKKLEKLPIKKQLQNSLFGGMDIQIGYCNGRNTKLNCLEYHKNSELNICLYDTYLILGRLCDVNDFMYDTANCKVFFVPAGTGVEIYETSLHYAPCHKNADTGFIVAIVLPKGTNGKRPTFAKNTKADDYLTCNNKWLLPHKDSSEAKNGAIVGLTGENIDIQPIL